MIDAKAIARVQDEATERWHVAADDGAGDGLEGLVLRQHRANFDLWHLEDTARDVGAADAEIVAVKRGIDGVNQLRNDLVEKIDVLLLEAVGEQMATAPLHSETPGMMIDRMSILALKSFHTKEETERATATAAHRERNAVRLRLLEEQRGDLAGCLQALWAEAVAGTRRFKLYRQMKMYNDSELNPVLYGRGGS